MIQGRTPLWRGTSLGGVVIVNTELLANASRMRSVRLEFVMQGRTPLWRGTSLGGVVIVNTELLAKRDQRSKLSLRVRDAGTYSALARYELRRSSHRKH